MHFPATQRDDRLRRRPLIAAVMASLALAAPDVLLANAVTVEPRPSSPHVVVVENCADNGAGSLRSVAAAAADGDTIDLGELACSRITLTTGAIVMAASDLTLRGPGSGSLSIISDGERGDGVLYSLGGGSLSVQGLTLAFGDKYDGSHGVQGGCVFAAGDLEIADSHLYGCRAGSIGALAAAGGAVFAQGNLTLINSVVEMSGVTTEAGDAKGGGVFAGGTLSLKYSIVADCHIEAAQSGRGGGAFAGGEVLAKYSTLRDNSISDASTSFGGGLHSAADVTILSSTVSGNHARSGGGLYMSGGSSGHAAQITASTISGNTAIGAGGINARLPLELTSSTVAFNTIPRSYNVPIGYSPSAGIGVRFEPVVIESSIVANNTAIGTTDEAADVGGALETTITGSNNLIGRAAQGAPAGTLSDDPRLGPLRNNGGRTDTHELAPHSPAVDAGNNGAHLTTDQRGPGYPREVGGSADIGAYERDPDRVFADGFD